MEFSDHSTEEITADQVRLAESNADGVVRAFVALDAGPRFVVDFDWQDLAILGALSNSLHKQGGGALATVTFVLNRLFAAHIERWQHMSYDDRAVELISLNLPIVSQ